MKLKWGRQTAGYGLMYYDAAFDISDTEELILEIRTEHIDAVGLVRHLYINKVTHDGGMAIDIDRVLVRTFSKLKDAKEFAEDYVGQAA